PRVYQEAVAALGALPGVRSATLLENTLLGGIISNSALEIDGERRLVYFNAVGPGLFETLGMRLLEGRSIGLQDGPDAPRVGVVNETAVQELFGGASPVGRVLQLGSREVQIVGVVNDTPYRSRREPVGATVHESAFQRQGFGGHHVVMRVDGPTGPLEPRIREAIRRIHPDLPFPGLQSQTEIIAETGARERIFTVLLTLFGGFALLLASIGLHGVTAYAVTRRTREIGVRVAVGARPGQILGLVLGQVVLLAGLGLLIGVPAALAAGPLVESLVYGVTATDPATVALAAVTMLGVAVAAGMLPALRAARMDVQKTLRTE
ncbi:MAG TPA: FtsX-like permease family protein, partial [Longimicrobiales bacterium]|nr:FtsX-like permease family protein [Longimicrobiales bacterium]